MGSIMAVGELCTPDESCIEIITGGVSLGIAKRKEKRFQGMKHRSAI